MEDIFSTTIGDTLQNDLLKFDMPVHQSSIIKVIGVGGGGSNAVNHMFRQGIKGVDFIVCNTDAQALEASPVPNKIQIGKGLGAGNLPSVAQSAAIENAAAIKAVLANNTKMLFITAGMGGGTGTGAAPVIAKIAKEIELDDEVNKILTVAIVTTPFSFEGRKRLQQAKEGIDELRKHVDAILVINNDKLRAFGNLPMSQAFAKADDILTIAAKGISEIITVESHPNIDFRDVNTVMQQSGVALMGYGIAGGENRAEEAIKLAINSPLLNDNNIKGSKNILMYLSSSTEYEVTFDEVDEITNIILAEVKDSRNLRAGSNHVPDIIWGRSFDESLGNKLSITLVATGFESKGILDEGHVPVVDLDQSLNNQTPVKKVEETPVNIAPAPIVEQKQAPEIKMEMLDQVEEQNMEMISQPSVEYKAEMNACVMEEPKVVIETIETTIQVKETETAQAQAVDLFSTKTETVVSDIMSDAHAEERRIKLKNLSLSQRGDNAEIAEKIRTMEGLVEIENEPAYKRRQVQLVTPVHSSESEVATRIISEDGKITSNPFLHDNVD